MQQRGGVVTPRDLFEHLPVEPAFIPVVHGDRLSAVLLVGHESHPVPDVDRRDELRDALIILERI
ncbi:hypothetical protein [Paraburkholderia caledonica]|uniref:hypothetical protein n=1 Tax=Paraburkholderia caledonica TaxID=134536 RepID=UPI0019D002FA|nr:hypothetical protein [Paraburkholderia caledonica]